MDKDKQIEEMAKDLENHTCMSQFQAEIASRMLYIKGYRKASDVASEIFEEIDSTIDLICAMTGLDIRAFGKYAEIKKKYTEKKDD